MADERKEAEVSQQNQAATDRGSKPAAATVPPKKNPASMVVRNPAPDASPPRISPGTFGTFQITQ